MLFPTPQQTNLPAFSPHCPFIAERQAGKLNINFKVIGLTRFGIKPESTGLEADALITGLYEPVFITFYYFMAKKIPQLLQHFQSNAKIDCFIFRKLLVHLT